MFRSQEALIEQLTTRLRDTQSQLGEARARENGRLRGESAVAGQLAADIRLSATREEQHRKNAARAYQDLQRVMRAVAAHVLDIADGDDPARSVQALRDELTEIGTPLRPAIIALQIERADSATASATTSAAEAAGDVASSHPVHA